MATGWLLAEAGLRNTDVDLVAYDFVGHRYLAGITSSPRYLLHRATRQRALPRAASFAVIHHRYRQRMKTLKDLFPNGRVYPVPHHRAHALYAFAASGFDQAAVLIADSLGETCTTIIGAARLSGHGGIQYWVIDAIRDPASLGYAYGAVTTHLGWRRGDEEGTVMALAALGDPARFRSLLARAIPLTAAGFALDAGLFPLRVLRHGSPRVTPALRQRPARRVGNHRWTRHAQHQRPSGLLHRPTSNAAQCSERLPSPSSSAPWSGQGTRADRPWSKPFTLLCTTGPMRRQSSPTPASQAKLRPPDRKRATGVQNWRISRQSRSTLSPSSIR
jgi:hypothetical protein